MKTRRYAAPAVKGLMLIQQFKILVTTALLDLIHVTYALGRMGLTSEYCNKYASYTAVQSQIAVTAHFPSKRLLLFAFVL